jgi:hypothetical protein
VVDSIEKSKSVFSLEEVLMRSNIDLGDEEEQEDLEAWLESHLTPSSIISKSKSGRKSTEKGVPCKKANKSLIEDFESCENINGLIQSSRRMETITISNHEIDIEFTLPRSRAGPLVVPYIAFDKYCTS